MICSTPRSAGVTHFEDDDFCSRADLRRAVRWFLHWYRLNQQSNAPTRRWAGIMTEEDFVDGVPDFCICLTMLLLFPLVAVITAT